VPDVFLPQGSRDEILAVAGLTVEDMTRQILERLQH
jgi:1-deoxy-D-xylulose-5-phosphate synthase